MKLKAGMTVVVTGAASGIGLALARGAAERGLNVVLADRDETRLTEAAATLGGASGSLAVVTDVSDAESVADLAAAATEQFGPIHLLANNAGILRAGTTYETPLEDYRSVFGINIFGVINAYHAFVPAMLAHAQPAHVLNTASLGGFIAARGASAYAVSKHAVVGLSECLAADLAGTTLGVTVLCPGGVATDIFAAEQRRRQADGVVGSAAVEERFARIADTAHRSDVLDPADVATVAYEAIEGDQLYAMVFPPGARETVRRRLGAIEAALEADEARPPLVHD